MMQYILSACSMAIVMMYLTSALWILFPSEWSKKVLMLACTLTTVIDLIGLWVTINMITLWVLVKG